VIRHWHNPTNGRRYQAVLGPDLFGDTVLWRGWCSADGSRGGERSDVFTWEEEGDRALKRVARRRERRGYVEHHDSRR
jgi:predicted DNA-binding WGR domain protein